MAPRLSQATPPGAKKTCINIFSKNKSVHKISNKQVGQPFHSHRPIGPSHSHRHVGPSSHFNQPIGASILEEAERYRQPINKQHVERQPSLGHASTSQRAQQINLPVEAQDVLIPPPIEHNAPLNAGERLQFLYLQREVKNLRKQVQSLTSSLEVAIEKLKDKIPCCSEDLVKKNLTDIVTKLFLGTSGVATLYPTDEVMIEAILASFDVSEDGSAHESFMKEWCKPNGFQQIVTKNLRDRRGSITTRARCELYKLLGCPRPNDDEVQELAQWFKTLEELRMGNKWRICVLEDGSVDPYGSDAIHGAVSRVLHGKKYNKSKPVQLTLSLAGFLLHVLESAMLGKRLNPLDMDKEVNMMKAAEVRLYAACPHMERVIIVHNDDFDSMDHVSDTPDPHREIHIESDDDLAL